VKTKKQTWRRAILPVTATIDQAIRNLEQVSIRIVLVTNEAGVLQGTVSDGDIRRGLLKGIDLSAPITTVLHRDALVVTSDIGINVVMELMVTNKLQQIPVVDERRKVVDLYLWDELAVVPPRPNLFVIMAGGKGTRMLPHTENCPKPLLPVAGKPMLEHIIERAKLDGFRHFVIATHFLGHLIEAYFENGERLGVRIDYLRELAPLGTAGALALLILCQAHHLWSQMVMFFQMSGMAKCSIFIYGILRLQPWLFAYTNGRTHLVLCKPRVLKLPNSKKSPLPEVTLMLAFMH